jgi:hypothetical protein
MNTQGKLEKLKILAYKKADYSEPIGGSEGTFEAYINPEEITLDYEMEYDSSQGAGTTNSRMDFKKVKPGDMSLTFFIDGTGANGKLIDVMKAVQQFQTVTSASFHKNIYKIVKAVMILHFRGETDHGTKNRAGTIDTDGRAAAGTVKSGGFANSLKARS